jgi:serine protease
MRSVQEKTELFSVSLAATCRSSWHGTHVAGTIGAATNNAIGIAGINWNARIVPVRALGVGGGAMSDIAEGILWAAGIAVPGLPLNPNPVKVINMSLGGASLTCPLTYQAAIDQAIAKKITVVVAAGNNNLNVSGFSPANCKGVVVVAANNRTGSKASYSNFGAGISIAAPGGEVSPIPANGILSTLDGGRPRRSMTMPMPIIKALV